MSSAVLFLSIRLHSMSPSGPLSEMIAQLAFGALLFIFKWQNANAAHVEFHFKNHPLKDQLCHELKFSQFVGLDLLLENRPGSLVLANTILSHSQIQKAGEGSLPHSSFHSSIWRFTLITVPACTFIVCCWAFKVAWRRFCKLICKNPINTVQVIIYVFNEFQLLLTLFHATFCSAYENCASR